MGSADRLSGVIALALAGVLVLGTRRLFFFKSGVPGPGFLPLVLAFFIAFCGVILLVAPGKDSKGPVWPGARVRWQIAGSYLALFVYYAMIPVVGFLLMTALFLSGLLWWWGNKGPWASLVFGGVGAALMFLIFRILLEVPVPMGIWAQ
jgi:hypothetical protein